MLLFHQKLLRATLYCHNASVSPVDFTVVVDFENEARAVEIVHESCTLVAWDSRQALPQDRDLTVLLAHLLWRTHLLRRTHLLWRTHEHSAYVTILKAREANFVGSQHLSTGLRCVWMFRRQFIVNFRAVRWGRRFCSRFVLLSLQTNESCAWPERQHLTGKDVVGVRRTMYCAQSLKDE